MTRALALLALLVASPVFAQGPHIGGIMGGPSLHEFVEYFDDGYAGEVPLFNPGLWEGPSLSAHTGVHVAIFRSGNRLGITAIGSSAFVESTNFGMTAADGWNIAGTATSNTGVEVYSNGDYTTGQPIILGSDPAVEFCATVLVDEHDGSQAMAVGWRRFDVGTNYVDDAGDAGAFTGDNYTDMIALGFYGADTAGVHDIKIAEIKDDAATAVTDTTDNWTEDTTKQFCTTLNANGTYSQTIDGSAPTAVASSPVTLNTGEWYIPFFRYLHDGTANITKVYLSEWSVRFR